MLTASDVKTHLLSLRPGDRFRLAPFAGFEVYRVVAGAGDDVAIVDSLGAPVSVRAVVAMNNGVFVHAIHREEL